MATELDLDTAYTPCEVVNYAMNKARDDGASNVGDLECTAEVISAFNNSYQLNNEVFLAQPELQFTGFSSINNARVPGMQYIPTKANENVKIFCVTHN